MESGGISRAVLGACIAPAVIAMSGCGNGSGNAAGVTRPDPAAITAAQTSFAKGVAICSKPLRSVPPDVASDSEAFNAWLRRLVKSYLDPTDDLQEALNGCASTEWGKTLKGS